MNSLSSLETDGVAMVDYPDDIKVAVEKAAKSWQIFCALSDEQKDLFADLDSSTTNGYERKDGVGNKADRKENFDISDGFSLSSAASTIDQTFTADAKLVAVKVKQLAVSTAAQIEEEFGVDQLEQNTRDGSIFIRFLHYYGDREAGEPIAQTHTDQSGFTFHLHETAEGCLRLDPKDKTWQSMPVKAGQAAVFGAMQLQYASEGQIKALAHKVVATEQTKLNGRFAIVAFIRLANTPVYDKTAHGRLQEMPDGFNYSIEADKFKLLFKNI